MTWRVGLDEAGYGPNLGPFVMTLVACQVSQEESELDLWELLRSVVRKSSETADGRLVVDDSKVVHSRTRGPESLEHPILAILDPLACQKNQPLKEWLKEICLSGMEDLQCEAWFRGLGQLPLLASPERIQRDHERFSQVCRETQVGHWIVRTVIVPTPRFNQIVTHHGSKGAVLAHGLIELLKGLFEVLPGNDPIHIAVDKHGGRNSYTAMLQAAAPGCMVWAELESLQRSVYRVEGLERTVQVIFQPRADGDHLPVALASMTAKYLREVLMEEFNRYWVDQVPGVKPTAGYPQDARRFLSAVQHQALQLGLQHSHLWREK